MYRAATEGGRRQKGLCSGWAKEIIRDEEKWKGKEYVRARD